MTVSRRALVVVASLPFVVGFGYVAAAVWMERWWQPRHAL